MSLSERVKAGAPVTLPGPSCTIGRLLATLPKAEASALRSMLDDPAWVSTSVVRALREEGHHLGKDAVGRHRRGDCSCISRGMR